MDLVSVVAAGLVVPLCVLLHGGAVQKEKGEAALFRLTGLQKVLRGK